MHVCFSAAVPVSLPFICVSVCPSGQPPVYLLPSWSTRPALCLCINLPVSRHLSLHPSVCVSALTWSGDALVVIEMDVVTAGDGGFLSLLLALAAVLLLRLPLLWGHNRTAPPR